MRTGENVRKDAFRANIRPSEGSLSYSVQALQNNILPHMLSFERPSGLRAYNQRLQFKAPDPTDDEQELPLDKTYICRICGNTIAGRPPIECPICGAPKEEFDVTQ